MAPFFLLLVTVAIASPPPERPTREQIVAFSERCKSEKVRMDLVAQFGHDFSGLDLSGVDFRGHHAVDFETNLRGADFSKCNLQRAEFGASILDGADFTGADLEDASFVTASLRKATLVQVAFKGTRIYQSDLSEANLARADLSQADITGSNFDGADLSDSTLSGARNDYWWNGFRGANLTRAKLAHMPLLGARFEGAVLRNADLSFANLTQADFTSADLTGATFTHAKVDSADFRDAKGLEDATRSELTREAQRWTFDLKNAVADVAGVLYFPIYALIVVTLVVLSFIVLRRPQWSNCIVFAIGVNLLALIPALALLNMSLRGAASTVQFNAGSDSAMALWSAWVRLWPLLMIMLLACIVVATICTVAFVATNWRWSALKRTKLRLAYLALTIAHCLFATDWVGSNFPSA